MESQSFIETTLSGSGRDLRAFWNRNTTRIFNTLENNLRRMGAIKSSISIDLKLEKDDRELDITLRAKSVIILETTNINDILLTVIEELSEKLSNFTRKLKKLISILQDIL